MSPEEDGGSGKDFKLKIRHMDPFIQKSVQFLQSARFRLAVMTGTSDSILNETPVILDDLLTKSQFQAFQATPAWLLPK